MEKLLEELTRYCPLQLFTERWDRALCGVVHRVYGGVSTLPAYDLSVISQIEGDGGTKIEDELREMKKGWEEWTDHLFPYSPTAMLVDLSPEAADGLTRAGISHEVYVDVTCAWLVGRAAKREKVKEYEEFKEKLHEGAFPTFPYVEDCFCGVGYYDSGKPECLLYDAKMVLSHNGEDENKLEKIMNELVTEEVHHPAWYFPCSKDFIYEYSERA